MNTLFSFPLEVCDNSKNVSSDTENCNNKSCNNICIVQPLHHKSLTPNVCSFLQYIRLVTRIIKDSSLTFYNSQSIAVTWGSYRVLASYQMYYSALIGS